MFIVPYILTYAGPTPVIQGLGMIKTVRVSCTILLGIWAPWLVTSSLIWN